MRNVFRKVDAEQDTSERPLMSLDWSVLRSILETVGKLPAETGGPIGGCEDDHHVSQYHFDESSRRSSVTYSPDYETLNRLFKEEWNPKGLRLRGFVHSHPVNNLTPSMGDEIYAAEILQAIPDLENLWLPIVNTLPDTGQFVLVPWIAFPSGRGVHVVRSTIQILDVPNNLESSALGPASKADTAGTNILDHVRLGVTATAGGEIQPVISREATEHRTGTIPRRRSVQNTALHGDPELSKTFDRVRTAYDLNVMAESRIIAVGAGGAAEWLEQLARAGLGQFVLIDPDTVSETNLATQQTYRRDIGRPKVDCVAERIHDINPSARIVRLQHSLDDLGDKELEKLTTAPIDRRRARQTIICGLTDQFAAQARVNRIALQLGIPSLNAQVYHEGRGAEITFTYPGVTPACHRCVLSSRYTHYLEQGLANTVTSHGTPIFATSRLNAVKGFLALALLHHGSDHPRWGHLLRRIGKRNLIQIRMDPDFSETMKLSVFDRVYENADQERILFDDVVWLPQEPENESTGYPDCPDCGGTGDLTNAMGRFSDTREEVGNDCSPNFIPSSHYLEDEQPTDG